MKNFYLSNHRITSPKVKKEMLNFDGLKNSRMEDLNRLENFKFSCSEKLQTGEFEQN